MARTKDFNRFVEACTYPGVIDHGAVQAGLTAYLAVLGVQRRVVQLTVDWSVDAHPDLARTIEAVAADAVKRIGKRQSAAQAALAALDARDARAALDARAAQDAQAARDALDAQDAQAALAARAARDAQAALAARAALDAQAAQAALAALDARDARDAQAALDARDAQDALDALDARDAQAAQAALAALDARDARDALDAQDAQAALAARAARDAQAALAALDALDARDARDAQAARRRFAAWVIQAGGWFWWRWELSWIVTTHLGAQQRHDAQVDAWAQPLFEAFIAGAWFLYWTDTTLYWVAKPAVHVEVVNGRRRLHCADGAAVESDIERLYFWHGVLVPAFVVLRPDWITGAHILQEENAEVRRVMIERLGYEQFLKLTQAKRIQADDYGELFKIELREDEPVVLVRVENSTPEPDGSSKHYLLRVPPQIDSARAAVAWSFDRKPEDYELAAET